MPIVRKLMRLGQSLVMTVPKSWIINYEKEIGQTIRELMIEANGILKVSPIFKKKK